MTANQPKKPLQPSRSLPDTSKLTKQISTMTEKRKRAFAAIFLGWIMFSLVAVTAITAEPSAEQYTKDKEATKGKVVLVLDY